MEEHSEFKLIEPYMVNSLEEVVLPGSVRALTRGCMGAIFSCRLHTGEPAVLKRNCTKLIVSWMNDEHGSINQRWLPRESVIPGYLNLFNEALPARALMASEGRVELGDFRANSERMMWRFTDEGYLIPKHFDKTNCRGLTVAREKPGARLILSREPTRWALRSSTGGAWLLEAESSGLVIDLSGDHALAELNYLATWAQPGLVALRHVVMGQDALSSSLVLKRLNKQLGPGTAGELPDCVLKDIQDGRCPRRSPREAARQLLNVARVLASMHLKGYTHNDLHSGNVLRNTAAVSSKFSVIDMGATCKADYWKDVLGPLYDEAWAITRDWRTFFSHLLSLVDGEPRALWDLVGTQDVLPFRRTAWAVPTSWSPCGVAATGRPLARCRWRLENERIVSHTGLVLQVDKRSQVTLAKQDLSGKSWQTWKVFGPIIQNVESGKCLQLEPCGKLSVGKLHRGRSQRWCWETQELLHGSGMALDAFGPRKLPQDVLSASKRPGRRWAELLEVFFRPRIDPSEVCRKLEALAVYAEEKHSKLRGSMRKVKKIGKKRR